MKTIFAVSLVALLAGCSTFKVIDRDLPAINAAEVSYTRTGKFSSTTIHATNVRHEDGKVKADEITLRHSNVYIPNIDITIKGYERELTKEDVPK